MRPWWHSAAIYQVYPRSFRDGNGDGLGDLNGVEEKLPYLSELGIDAIWLSPFYPSPQHDSGYDVADPRDVDPMYGTLADAQSLIDRAHDRGIKVIVDVVPNHGSVQHRWFQEALASPPSSPARARFHFRDGRGEGGSEPPTNWMSMFGGSAWTRIHESDGSLGQWYLHIFDSSQPDFNWSNPEVRHDWLTTLAFWLDRGVDGFRVDVAFGLAKDMEYPEIENPEGLVKALRLDLDTDSPEGRALRAKVANSAIFDRDELYEIYRDWRELMNRYSGDRMAVAEAWVAPERAAMYVGGDTLHQIFNFEFLSIPLDSNRICAVVQRTLDELAIVKAPATWALSNHDTPRVVSRLISPEFDEGQARTAARSLALIAHSLPGSVYVYQGEELGLADAPIPDSAREDPVFIRTNGEQLGRDAARVPLPWSGDKAPYGFSDAVDAVTWLPQPSNWAAFTAAAESADPNSTLAQYRHMLRLRHELPALADLENADVDEILPGVVRVTRGSSFTCLVNCTHSTVHIPAAAHLLVASDQSVMVDGESLTLPPATGAWLSGKN
jgi:alpha-glucosidase